MIHELQLVPRGGSDTLVVNWNDETGAIAGDAASLVYAVLDRYQPGQMVTIEPIHCSYILTQEPRRSLADMAAILHNHFEIPAWLMHHYPPPIADEVGDDGEDGGDLPVIEIEY